MRIYFASLAILFLASCTEEVNQNENKYLVEMSKERERVTALTPYYNTLYKTILTDHNATVGNFHLLYTGNRNKDSIRSFVKWFGIVKTSRKFNISLYDSEKVKNLVLKYPLTNSEEKKILKHLIAYKSFETTDITF